MTELAERAAAVKGHVVAETRDADGRLVSRWEGENTYTEWAAWDHAAALAGEAPDLTLTAIGLGSTGFVLDECEATTGWTTTSATVSVDTASYVQGGASLKVAVAVSTTGTAKHVDIVNPGHDATGDYIELSMCVDYTGRLTKGSTYLRIYTGAGSATYFQVSLTAIEALVGALSDGTWKRNIRIPVASFGVGAGSPSWADVRGVGIVVAANAGGAVNVWLDDIRIWQTVDTAATNFTLPGLRVQKTLAALDRDERVVTAVAFWNMSEAVGTYYNAGLFAGSTLVSLLAFPYEKDAGLTLKVTWTLTTQGGV